jgi:predicted exporter
VLIRFCMRHRRVAMLLGLGVTLAALALAFRLRFDESMRTMRPQGNRGNDVAAEVSGKFGSGFSSMILLLSGSSPEEVVELAAKAAAGAQRLVGQDVLQGFSGVTSLIPPPEQQRAGLDWVQRERGGALDLARIHATFTAAATREGLRVEPLEPGFELLGQAINLSGPIGVADFAGSKQTRLLLDRFLKKTNRGWKGAVYLYPQGNQWRREPPPGAVELAKKLGPRAILTGTNVINQTVRQEVLEDAWIAGVLGYVLVAILLWIDFRTLRHTVMALAPLTVGIVWMMGSMSLLDIQMNFINIFVTTMIIGIGVDYGIYVLHRYLDVRDRPDAEYTGGLQETGKAVVAAAMSTTLGFGSITFSHYPGLVSTGKVAALGAICTSLVAITLLPTFLTWRREMRKRNQETAPARRATSSTAAERSSGTSS